jgi:hypothetical protein
MANGILTSGKEYGDMIYLIIMRIILGVEKEYISAELVLIYWNLLLRFILKTLDFQKWLFHSSSE